MKNLKRTFGIATLILLVLLISAYWIRNSGEQVLSFSIENPISFEQMDDLMNGPWDVWGFQSTQERPVYLGQLVVSNTRYVFESIPNIEDQRGLGFQMIDHFLIDQPMGVIGCEPIISAETIVEIQTSALIEDAPFAFCYFYSSGEVSRSHTIHYLNGKSLYFDMGRPSTIHTGSITKSVE